MRLAVESSNGVAGLMIGGQALFILRHNAALLFGTGNNLDGCFLDFRLGDGFFAFAGSQKRRLIDEVFKVCTGEAGRGLGDRLKADIGAKRLVAGMNTQNLLTALHIGQSHIDLTVKTARTKKGFIENIRTVGGSHHDNAVIGIKSVHLDKELVKGLLAFIVTAAKTCAALAAHRINLIDKDDGGHRLFGFFKKVTHTGSANANIHFHEIGTGNGVERNAGFTGASAGQESFAGTRRADKQNTVGNPCAEGIELVGSLEEFNDFLKFSFFLISTGNIGKGCFALAFLLIFDLGTAHIHQAVSARTAAVH